MTDFLCGRLFPWAADPKHWGSLGRRCQKRSLLCCDHVIEFGSPVRKSICHAAGGLCPLFYLGLSRNSKHSVQISAKSKIFNFQNALRATVLKIQPSALVHISFSCQSMPLPNLVESWQLWFFVTLGSRFLIIWQKNLLWWVLLNRYNTKLVFCSFFYRHAVLHPMNGFWPSTAASFR